MLEAKNQFIIGMLAGAAILGGGMLLAGAARHGTEAAAAPNPTIRTSQIEIVDELGTVVMVLGVNKDGGSLSVRDRLGKTLVLAGASEHGGALVVTNTRAAHPAFIAQATADGGAFNVIN